MLSASLRLPSVRWIAFVGVAAAVLAVAFAVKANLASGGDRAPGREAVMVARGQNPPMTGGAPSAALTERFSVFRDPRTGADDIRPRAEGALVSHFFTDQAHLAAKLAPLRGPGYATDADLFIAGGPNDTICVLALPPGASGPGGQCIAADVAASGRDVVTLERRSPAMDIYGVVPDGVAHVTVALADGTSAVLPVADNVYSATFPEATKTVSYESPDGPVTINASA